VHAAGIEFDDAFFVRQAAQSDAVIVGVVLGPVTTRIADSKVSPPLVRWS